MYLLAYSTDSKHEPKNPVARSIATGFLTHIITNNL